jgi:L-threonylcarbamoyladenylate synthase
MVDIQGDQPAIDEAVRRLRAGVLVVIPTETVYGLAGRTADAGAIDQIFALKGRPLNNPLIAHVLDATGALSVAAQWPDAAKALAAAFWPGPLTMIVKRHPDVPARASAGLGTIAVRAPQHPVARAILEGVGEAISAPSANRSGRVSPTSADHVRHDYEGVQEASDLLVVDGGPCECGIESTVIDLTSHQPRLLRMGAVLPSQIEAVIGPLVGGSLPTSQEASPGTRSQHYAPAKPVRRVDSDGLGTALAASTSVVSVVGGPEQAVHPPHHHLALAESPEVAARTLYSLLRRADTQASDTIMVVLPPDTPPWQAVRDRLLRASVAESG